MLDEVLMISETYVLTQEGILLVQQAVGCTQCDLKAIVYVNMSIVENDKLLGAICPNCQEESIEILTYKLA